MKNTPGRLESFRVVHIQYCRLLILFSNLPSFLVSLCLQVPLKDLCDPVDD